jgi:murein L,D-transpeptidase YcbB/YkuD
VKPTLLKSLLGATIAFAPLPALAATSPEFAPPAASTLSAQANPADAAAVDGFYAQRHGAPLWFRAGGGAAPALSALLRRATLDGLAAGPELARAVDAAASNAASGDPRAVATAERTLSAAWLAYVEAIHAPTVGLTYADPSLAPRPVNAWQVLGQLAAAPSLAAHLDAVSAVNPIYARLRDAAWATLQKSGDATPDPRLLANLARARALPSSGRFIVVDAATQRLTMVEDGHIADSMKVIVGRPDSQTPMLASTIWYATVNPYWYVPTDLARKLIAPHMLAAEKATYLGRNRYEIISDFGVTPTVLPPSSVDWKAVAAGTQTVYLRQRPGPGNSMGVIKFPFPNDIGVYLHDTDNHLLFAKDQRTLSNGCVRLEDAPRLGRWLMGHDVAAQGSAPEQQVRLAQGVPVFLTYLTAQPQSGELAFVDDVYGRDGVDSTRVASR